MSLKAYVFARPGGAIILGAAQGHAAFGFETGKPGEVLVGGVELAGGKMSHINDAMDFWTEVTMDPLTFMAAAVPYGPHTRYDMAKIENVANPNPTAALAQIEKIRNRDYSLIRQNCLTDTVEVLQAFGIVDFPGGGRPGEVFGGVHASIIPLITPWPGWALDASIYEYTDQFGIRTDVHLSTAGSTSDPAADARDDSGELPTPSIGSILLRSGYFAIYSQRNFGGEPHVLTVGKVFNFRDTGWPDTTIRSWYASTSPFEAKGVGS